MSELKRLKLAEFAWTIEEYHRVPAVLRSRAQRNHIGLAIRAFLRLEVHLLTTGISWFEAKVDIVRAAVRAYLTYPRYCLTPTA